MTPKKTIHLIRIGEARALTRGGDEYGILEVDFTHIKPLG